ncbi:MAG: transglutaminase-like cysteine peptidase [Pseudomonadales bacterium]
MRRIWCLVVSLMVVSAASADFRRYSFDTDDHYLTDSSHHGLWSALVEQHARERAILDACLADRKQCPRHLKGFHQIVTRGRALSERRQLVLVNKYVNKRHAIRQNERRPRGDDGWKSMATFLKEGGDCEDFAIAKYFLLRELGFDAQDLRIVITWDRKARAYHALLAVDTQPRALLLETNDTMLAGARQRNYRFLYSINEHGVWDHMRHAGLKRLPRW